MADTATEEQAPDQRSMPLIEHLVELRTRLLYCCVGFILLFFICFYFAEPIFGFLVHPLAVVLHEHGGSKMIYTALHEAFFTYVKVAFFGAAFLGFPLFSVQIWLFVAPGLYRNEKRAILPFLIATPLLFCLGAALVYYVVMPLAWEFFLGFQRPAEGGDLAIEVLPKISEYLSLVMRLIFAFGIGFEMPVLLILLVRAGIISAADLAAKRRYAIVGVFVAAAVLTPPDVLSQIALALPILVLYEASIIGARIVERKRAEREAAEDADAD